MRIWIRQAARSLARWSARALALACAAGELDAQLVEASGSPQIPGSNPAAPFGAQTWYVDAGGTPPGSGTPQDPYTDLAAALRSPALGPGDMVIVAPGIYPGPVRAPSFGVVVLATHGAGETAIDGQGLAPALSMKGSDGVPVVFVGFTLENGQGDPVQPIFSAGGGLQAVNARFELWDCAIRDSDAFWGGGLMAKNSVGVLRQCTIEHNTNTGFGGRGAGVLVDGGSLAIESSTIRSNVSGDFFAPGSGGGIYVQGGADLDARDTLIELNVAELGGGGVFGAGDYLDCTLRGNEGQFGGGANATAATTFTNCLIETNIALSAGGTSHFGGAVWGPATLTGCTVRGNIAFGGVAGVDGGLLLDCTVLENLAVPGFGGVSDLAGGAGRCVILDTTLAANAADSGGLYFARGGGAAESTLVDCDVYDNQVGSSPDSWGGGLYQCDARRSRLFDNTASGAGGGAAGGTLFRCTLYDNHAEAGGGAAEAAIDHCTLEGNSAALGDGLWVGPVQLAVTNAIFYGNGNEEIAVDQAAALVVSYCDVRGGWPGTGNIAADPLFVAPGAHDYHLQFNSPCTDRGDPAYPLDPDGSRTDMGALRGRSRDLEDIGQRGGFSTKP